jgi:tRNA(Ile)-lysidine synthase
VKLPRFTFEIGRSFGVRLRGHRVLVACSGGVDSVTLVDVLAKLAPRFGFTLALAHVHHGPAVRTEDRGHGATYGARTGAKAAGARDGAREFVRGLARERGLEFFERESGEVLRSEERLREFRRKALDEMVEESEATVVALGHHADDLLETRVMRLIRGTGPTGLKAMRASTKKLVRPFLSRTRDEIAAYAREQKLTWIDDPSNEDRAYFRNWLRHEWLPLLEQKRPGSRAALARSLDLLCEAIPRVANASPRQSRREFHELSPPKKRAIIAAIASGHGVRDFGASKIIEVLKRLDRLEVSRRRRANFKVGGLEWSVTSDEIVAQTAGARSAIGSANRSD